MGNRVATAEEVFWNCGLNVTTGGVKYRASYLPFSCASYL